MVHLEWYALSLIVLSCQYTLATDTHQLWRKQNEENGNKLDDYLIDDKDNVNDEFLPYTKYRTIHQVPLDEEEEDSDAIDVRQRRFGSSSFAPMRGKRTFDEDDIQSDIENDDNFISPRERRYGLSSFIASRGKRLEDIAALYKDADLFKKRARGFGPSSFIGSRGKRMIPMLSLPNGRYQKMLGKVIGSVLRLSGEKSKGKVIPEKRQFGFTALRGRR